ncbi:CpsD/CapB family tyrosine-protein kinase [Listeria booriae]|uniref:CpsD/CapB family tyrosine-protein kinase n=1 Tax=Listeria booriae TaxID=1552123 RepID=A0A842G9I2_9LIST|nr:CpsD/CapB family tyrosine-protein kinase [Listeria booriae]MBC2285020.1 CpsD/CapB family tyrosine-protein kinase [Listeria booriae]MBC2292782.1 CpsD/CapB family tyrosine-protein kinase [Listeria booriae]MBC2676163.1 CpsD/CapB family tyrosine-protein kinase [Listeria booriae]
MKEVALRQTTRRKTKKKKHKDHFSAIDEQFKLIRTGIDFSGIDHKKQVILVTSPESGTGKSTISSHLAVAYAQRGERTLLIDADMRKPTLHKRFFKSMYIGLSNMITGEVSIEDGLQGVQLKDCSLTILASGPIPPNPNELLTSKKMMELLQQLRNQFDVIIIDTPPVNIVSDALVLADATDGTILVCRNQKTLKEKAKHAVSKLKQSKAPLLGVIFNGTKNVDNYYY